MNAVTLVFAVQTTKVHKQIRKYTTIVMNGWKKVNDIMYNGLDVSLEFLNQ